ncbi:hypothetical protein Syun_029160 [Stephania yunnanensis]|uniref:Patatin n=1 Tax=Stephania yunnanensis TaxID=152371 RepID=A0AAP0E546_9MAGN
MARPQSKTVLTDTDLSKITLEIFSKLEQKWLSHCDTTTATAAAAKKTRILSIDGGGTLGLVSGSALIHLEHHIQAKTSDPHSRIADFFDLVAGTGIGALYAALLTADDGSGRPLFTACDAVRFVADNHSDLFKTTRLSSPFGLLKRRFQFSSRSMERTLKDVMRRRLDGKFLTLKDTCKPILVPCYDLNTSAPFVYSRADALESPSFDFELWKVCRATSATPNLFKPFELTSLDGKTRCLAIDGGLVMNNPTAAAVTHVLHNKRDFPCVNGIEDLLVLSLGNGPLTAPSTKPLRRNGKCSTPSVVNIVMDGVSETVDQMLGNAFCWNPSDYVRIQANGFMTEKTGTSSGAEVLKERGVESLPFGGKRLLTETNGQRIETFVQRLVASGKSTSLPPSPCKQTVVSSPANDR